MFTRTWLGAVAFTVLAGLAVVLTWQTPDLPRFVPGAVTGAALAVAHSVGRCAGWADAARAKVRCRS